MKPIRHPTSNGRMQGNPEEWDRHGTVTKQNEFFISRGSLGGMDSYISFWKPSADELAMLLAGGSVQIVCFKLQPGIAVNVAPDAGGSSIGLAADSAGFKRAPH